MGWAAAERARRPSWPRWRSAWRPGDTRWRWWPGDTFGIRAGPRRARVAGAAEAAGAGAEVVLLDDGFQHRRLARSADVVVVDPRWPSEGGVLPAGEAREGLSALTRADLLWLSGPGELRGAPEGLPRVRSRLVPTGWRHGGAQLPLDQGPPGPLAAFAGIHRPGRFLAELVALGLDVRRWQAFADHRRWTLQEQADLVDWGVGCSLVCTEKDRVRLPETFDVWVLTVACELLHGEAALEQLLDRVMA